MLRIWRVFWHEYITHLTRRSYLLFTFGFPLFVGGAPVLTVIIIALVLRSAMPPTDPRPIAVIDQAGLLKGVTSPNRPVSVLMLPTVEEAKATLADGRIQAYYQVRPDYWQTGAVTLAYHTAPNEAVRDMFDSWVRERVRARVPSNVLARLDKGPNVIHRDPTGTRVYDRIDGMRAIIIFVLIYFVRLGGAFTAEYMFGSIAGEADNRTLELLMTSISPLQFVVGKFLGLLAVGLTQLGMWSGVALGLGLAATTFLNRNLLEPLLDWEYLGLIATMLLAAYVMDQLLAAALGLLRVSGGAGGLLFGVLSSLVGLALLYAAYLVPRHPHTFLAVAASLFPVTAPLVLPIRLVVTEVPAWQIILSQVFVWGTILASFFWLRRLLQRNLLSYAPPFKLIRWLAARWPARGRQV